MTWFNLTIKQSFLLEQCVQVDGPGFQAGSSTWAIRIERVHGPRPACATK